MNLHIPQSVMTHEELKEITMVPTQIISPGTSKPCMKIMVDTLIGSYLLTQPDTRLSRQEFQDLLTFSPYYNGKLPEPAGEDNGVPYWLGRQIISMILPDISLPYLKDAKIVRGDMIDGYLSEDCLGTKPTGIIQQIYNVYGKDQMTRFMNDIEKLVTRWLITNSFSIGFGDAVIKKTDRIEVNKIIEKEIQGAYDILIRAQEGMFALELDDSLRSDKLEVEINTALNNVSEKVKKYIGNIIDKKNGFKEAIDSGSTKGNMGHIMNITALVGKFDIWGKRVPNEFTHRTLPHYAKYDLSPEAKGYCKDSLILGMNPADCFFGAMNGRNGKIDTAIKTADSGYISRKFIKATEDLVIAYDLTVRNASNVIVQFAYGDDNMDPSKIEKITKIDLIEMDNEKMKKTFLFEEMGDRGYWETFMMKKDVDEMMKDPKYTETLMSEYEEMMGYREDLRHKYFKNCEMVGDISTYVSINPQRLIQSTLVKFNIEKFSLSDLTPMYVIEKFDSMMDSIVQYFPEKEKSIRLQRIIFKSFLASKRVINEYRMNKYMFDYVLQMIQMKMMLSIITPGETVGVLAAQTLGEGTTQMTLNTFHSISSAASVITEGLPRLNEIIKLTKNMKNKNMKIYLKEEFRESKEQAKKLKTQFAYTKMKDLLSSSEIIYMGSESYTDTNEEREFIRSYQDFTQLFGIEECKEEELSPWMIRFVFDKESMMNRNISILEIQEKIKEKESDDIECPFSDDSASNVVMRVRYKKDNSDNVLQFMRDFEKQLSEMTIRGIDGIEIADVVEKNFIKYQPDGSCVPSKEWIVQTKGSNILDIMSDDSVDYTRTTTNDIIDFVEIFGIEAARNMLIQEYSIVYQSNSINSRHIELIADVMSYRGKLMQIDRHGINKNPDIGPIGKASFEAVMDTFIKSALFAEKDNMKGTSANIFAGQFCKAGTNAFEIIMDDEKLMKEIPYNAPKYEEKKEVSEDYVDEMIESLYAKNNNANSANDIQDEDFDFGFGMELEKQSVLTGPNMSHVQIIDKKTGSINHMTVESKDMANERLMVPDIGVPNNNQNTKLTVPNIAVEEDEEDTKMFVPKYDDDVDVDVDDSKVEKVEEPKRKTKKVPNKKK